MLTDDEDDAPPHPLPPAPWWAALLALLVAVATAWWASVPPAPLPANAPATAFSADRAMADLRAGFSRPHPIGSAEARRTIAYLAGRMRSLGLEVRVQRTAAAYAQDDAISGGDLTNLVGLLPGRNRRLPALLIMAHYDTVPSAPGAGDDGFGVAGGLEIVRALKARGTPARDVILLFTDGEEAGLLGARAFLASDPLRARVGMVLNMDTRGDAGRAIMYETGPAPGGLVRLYAGATADPTTDSVAAFVRRGIRNSSDFAITAAAGLPGLNYAVLGNQFGYHAASSTPDRIDRGSLQHYGAGVLAGAVPLAFSARWPAAAAEPAYASLLGITTIVYDAWVGWLIIAAAAAIGGLAFRRRPPGAVARGFGIALWLLVAGGIAIHLMRLATGVPYGFTAVRPLLARFGLFEGAVAAMGAALMLVALVGWRRGRFIVAGPLLRYAGGSGDPRPATRRLAQRGEALLQAVLLAGPRGAVDRSAGLFLAVLLLAIAAQVLAPTVAVLLCWTLLAGAVVLLLATWPRAAPAAALVAGLAVGQVLATGHLILLTVGENMPEAAALFVLLAALPLAPLLREQEWLRPAALVLAAAALALVLAIRLLPVGSPDRPRPSQLFYVSDADGRAWRASSVTAIDPWTDAMLKADGANGWARRPLPPLFVGRDYRRGVALAAARRVPVTAPRIERAGDTLVVTPPPGTRQVNLRLVLHTGGSARMNGSAEIVLQPGEAIDLRWAAPRGQVAVRLGGRGPALGLVSVLSDGLPSGTAPLAPRSPDTMPWYNDGTTLVIRRIDLRR